MFGRKRLDLALQQAAFLDALLDRNKALPGASQPNFSAAAQSLVDKRLAALRRCWPQLAAEYADELRIYCRTTDIVESPLVDGRRLAEQFDKQGRLSVAVAREVILFDLHYRLRGSKLLSRPIWTFHARSLKAANGHIFGARIFHLHFFFSLPGD